MTGQGKSVGRICKEFFKDNFFPSCQWEGLNRKAFLWCRRFASSALCIKLTSFSFVLNWGSSLPEPSLCTGVSFKDHILDYVVCLFYFLPWNHQDGSLRALYFSRNLQDIGWLWYLLVTWDPFCHSFSFHVFLLSYICGDLRFLLICWLQGFSSFKWRGPSGYLIYHLGGNKTSFTVLEDWWYGVWRCEANWKLNTIPRCKENSMASSKLGVRIYLQLNKPSKTSVSGWDWN